MFIKNLYCLSVQSENKITKILRETKEITRTLRETDKITNFSRETKQITTILCETEKITKNVAWDTEDNNENFEISRETEDIIITRKRDIWDNKSRK